MRTPITYLGLAFIFLSAVDPARADSISMQDREEIARLRSARGFAAEEISPLLEQVNNAGARGIPAEPLANKVKEGLAKGVDPKRIDPVLRQMVTHFESAQEALREAEARGVAEGNRRVAVETLAEAFSRGATADEVRELARLSQDGKQKVTQESLAAGAKSLAVMKEAKISSKDSAALIGEGIRQGYKPSELLDLRSNGGGVSFNAVVPASRHCVNRCVVANGRIDSSGTIMANPVAEIVATAAGVPIMESVRETIGVEAVAVAIVGTALTAGDALIGAGVDTAAEIIDGIEMGWNRGRAAPKGAALLV